MSFTKTINKNYYWISPLLIFTTTLSSAFLTYNFPKDFAKIHPARYQFFNPIIDNIILIFIISALLLSILTIIEIFNKKTIEKLESENEQYEIFSEKISENIKELFNGFLYSFANSKANFSTNERVTVYIHNGNNSFVPFGRYSANTKFAKTGRPIYPDSEGCIAKGWEEQWYFENTLLSQNETEYLNTNETKYSMNKDIVKKLNMKSNLFAVLRLDVKNTPIAVIVVESVDSTKYTEKQIKKFLEDQQDYLSEMIISLEKFIPKPSNAQLIEGM